MGVVRHDKAELLFNAKKIIEKLWYPHLTEKIEVHYPLTFPCTEIYVREGEHNIGRAGSEGSS